MRELASVLRADRARRDDSDMALALDATYRCLVVLRVYSHLKATDGLAARVARVPLGLWLRRARRYGFDIDPSASIGPGLYLSGHPGGIVVNPGASIGRDCNLSHGVTIGQASRGAGSGAPVVGHRVWVGPGAIIAGAVHVGDDAMIGPNCVITEDVPARAVMVAGRPSQVSDRGSVGYVNRVSG